MVQQTWWAKGLIYQVYPRSFQDTNADGIGDLNGIAARLDDLVALGVDAVWLSPFYPSPMADFGYDVSDYEGVDPIFGTLADFERLVREAHERGLRVIVDLVPNHTSDQHPWFREARASRHSAKRDWYIWRDPAQGGGPPNNWLSEFGGSAWTLDEASGQYYYHAFLSAQPDINWRNPQVAEAIHDVMRFWMRLGVDGFRVDVIWHLMKDEDFRDNPPNPGFTAGMNPYRALLATRTTDLPEVHDVIRGLRRVVDEFPDRVLIGEVYLPIERLAAYYGAALDGAHLPFNFSLLETPWDARAIADLIATYEASLPEGAWPNWVLSNHDRPRVASRVGPAQARVAMMLLLTLRGTPTLYYGDEIGMTQVAIPPERVQDPWEKNVPGLGLGRDGARTPMPWGGGPLAGFSTVEPWLPLGGDHARVNVAAQQKDPSSMLALTRTLIALRRASPALSGGAYVPIAADGALLAYGRAAGDERWVMLLNLGHEPLRAAAPELVGTLRLSTRAGRAGAPISGAVTLAGDEGVMIALAGAGDFPERL